MNPATLAAERGSVFFATAQHVETASSEHVALAKPEQSLRAEVPENNVLITVHDEHGIVRVREKIERATQLEMTSHAIDFVCGHVADELRVTRGDRSTTPVNPEPGFPEPSALVFPRHGFLAFEAESATFGNSRLITPSSTDPKKE